MFYHKVETEDVDKHEDSKATLLKGNHDQHVF